MDVTRQIFCLATSSERPREDRVHIDVSVRALERHDDASRPPPPSRAAPSRSRDRDLARIRDSARDSAGMRVYGVYRAKSRAFSVDFAANRGPIFLRRSYDIFRYRLVCRLAFGLAFDNRYPLASRSTKRSGSCLEVDCTISPVRRGYYLFFTSFPGVEFAEILLTIRSRHEREGPIDAGISIRGCQSGL